MTNNNKVNWFLSYWYVWTSIIAVIFTIAIAFGNIQTNAETIKETKAEVKVVREKADANEKAIIGLQKDVSYIKETVDKIDKKL